MAKSAPEPQGSGFTPIEVVPVGTPAGFKPLEVTPVAAPAPEATPVADPEKKPATGKED